MKNKITVPLIAFVLCGLIVLIFRGIPLIENFIGSFLLTSEDGGQYVSFESYLLVLGDEVFWEALGNSLLLLLHIPILFLLSLAIAMVLFEGVKFATFYKTLIVFPQILSTVIVASVFGALFGYNGPINAFIELFGSAPFYWLGEKTTAFFVITLCIIYTSFGWQTLIFSGALSTIDPNVKMLARLDGVGFFRKSFIYFCAIKKTVFLSIILNIIYGLSGFFSIVFTLTKGGPGYQTTTIDYLIYLRAFKYGSDMSQAYVIAVMLLLVIVLLSVITYLIFYRGLSNAQSSSKKIRR